MSVVTLGKRIGLAAALTVGLWNNAIAFSTFGSGGSGSKWDDPTWGTGATITWSFMDPGVALGPKAPGAWSGTNSLGTGNATDIRKIIDDANGAGAFDMAVDRAFSTWAAAANLVFVQVADQGGDFGEAVSPDIRIGAFDFNDFAGGAGFGPPGDDLNFPDSLAGDLALNDSNLFAIDPNSEGQALTSGPNGEFVNDLEGLLVHEIGHTLGLGHSDVVSSLMCGFIDAGFDGSACDNLQFVKRQLDADDIAGIQTLYGPAAVPLPAALWLFGSGILGLIGVARRKA